MQMYFYETIDNTKLPIYMFSPTENEAAEKHPAAILFYGGGWIKNNIDQFKGYAAELSRLGMVVAVSDYRVFLKDGTTVDKAISDAMSAVQFVFDNAETFNIDCTKIAVGGASAGGHLAVSTVILKKYMPQNYTCAKKIAALLLFNPVLDTVTIRKQNSSLMQMNCAMEDLSPLYHITSEMPDTIIFHGTDDTVVNFDLVLQFQKKMQKLKNNCEVIPFAGRKHGFFNLKATQIEDSYTVLGKTVQFLSFKGLLNLPT